MFSLNRNAKLPITLLHECTTRSNESQEEARISKKKTKTKQKQNNYKNNNKPKKNGQQPAVPIRPPRSSEYRVCQKISPIDTRFVDQRRVLKTGRRFWYMECAGVYRDSKTVQLPEQISSGSKGSIPIRRTQKSRRQLW